MRQVVATFQRMRQEQRGMASKSAELEMDINEHRSVAGVSTALNNIMRMRPKYQMSRIENLLGGSVVVYGFY